MIDSVFGHCCAAHRAQRFTHFLQNRIVRSQIRWTNYGDQFMVQPVDETDEFFPCTTLVDASFLIHGDSVRFIRSLQGVDRVGSARRRSRSYNGLHRWRAVTGTTAGSALDAPASFGRQADYYDRPVKRAGGHGAYRHLPIPEANAVETTSAPFRRHTSARENRRRARAEQDLRG